MLPIPLWVETPPGEFDDKYKLPWLTWLLIAVNVLVFGLQLTLGKQFSIGFGCTPVEITRGEDLRTPQVVTVGEDENGKQITATIEHGPGPLSVYLTLLTCMFLHGDILHLFSNMLFLGVFGAYLERLFPRGLYLAFYLLAGVVGALAHVLSYPDSYLPAMGASAAIAGVVGACLLLIPMKSVTTLLFILVYPVLIPIPVFIYALLWFLIDAVCGFVAVYVMEGRGGGVGYTAHIGGFVVGFVFAGIAVYLEPEKDREETVVAKIKARAAEAAKVKPLDIQVTTLSATPGVECAGIVAICNDRELTPERAKVLKVQLDWGDGSPPEPGEVRAYAEGGYNLHAKHTFAHSGTFLVTITLTEPDPEGMHHRTVGSATSMAIVGDSMVQKAVFS